MELYSMLCDSLDRRGVVGEWIQIYYKIKSLKFGKKRNHIIGFESNF